MGLLDMMGHKYPFTDFHELNLDWCITAVLQLQKAFEDFSAGNKLIFADPLQHDLTKTYAKNTIVIDPVSGTAYLSLDEVPKGVHLDNTDYWLPVFDFAGYITRANQNFTDNYFSGTDRTPIALAVGDWVVLDDILYKVTAAMAEDDLFIIGTNIVHFTVEQFLKDFVTAINATVLQYKNDIDASELAYRQQLAQDIADTTASLQAQLNAAIAGATVDSEVINARVGWDNEIYSTLRDAIVGQGKQIFEAVQTIDAEVNNIHTLVDYDYSLPYEQVAVPGGSWKTDIGVKRVGQIVTLNRANVGSGRVLIRLNSTVDLQSTNAQVDTWTGGILLKGGHKYKLTSKLLSGTSTYDSDVGSQVPLVVVNKAGTHTYIDTGRIQGSSEFTQEFNVISDNYYNLAIYIDYNKYTFTNAKFLITLEDLTESADYYNERTIYNNERMINNSHSYIDYDYDTEIDIPKGDGSTWKKCLGVTRFKNYLVLNKSVQNAASILVKLNGDDVDLYTASQLSSITEGFTLTAGHNYRAISMLIGGVSTYDLENNVAPEFIVIKAGEILGTGTRKLLNKMSVSEFTAEANEEYNFFLYTPPSTTAETIYTNAEVIAILQDITVAQELDDYPLLPYYYDSYIDSKVNEVELAALNIGMSGLRFVFFTDYHRQNNALQSSKLINEITKRTCIRSVVFGGDSQQSENTKLGGYQETIAMINDFSDVAQLCKMYYITGNHEMNNPSGDPQYDANIVPESVIGQLYMEQMNDVVPLYDENNSFYHDDVVSKIRTYFIGCDYKAVISIDTRRKFADSLLTVPDGYTVLVISHVALEWDSDNNQEVLNWRAENIMDLCVAMNDGTSVTIYLGPDQTLGRTYDFTGHQRDFIGMISGHTHRDGYIIYDNRFPVISTATDAYEVQSHIVPPPHGQEVGTIYEQCFDVVQITTSAKYIYMTRIGDGSNRTFKYGTGAGPV